MLTERWCRKKSDVADECTALPWLPLLPFSHSPTFPPQKAEWEAVALQQAESWAIQLGSACTPKQQAQTGTEVHPSQGAGSAPNSTAKPKSNILEVSYILDIRIQRNLLCCLRVVLCSWLLASSKRFSEYKGQSCVQRHWSAAEIGHLAKPSAFKYPLPKPENDDYRSPLLIISFLSQKRNIKRERP